MHGETERVVRKILNSPHQMLSIFRDVPPNRQGFVLLRLPRRIRQHILSRLKNEEIIKLLHYLDPDVITDLLQRMTKKRRETILESLSEDQRKKVEFLMKFNPRTAAGIMSLNYIEVDINSRFDDVSKIIRKHEKRSGNIPTILVVEDGFLVGELPGYVLALHRGNEKIKKHIKRVPHIRYDKDEKEVIRTFKNHPHDKIVVLDADNSIMGVIFSGDILKLIQKESARTLALSAGVREDEDVLDPTTVKVKYRYKWLIVNLGTAFLAASVVSLFQDPISVFPLLAVYMPIVAGMGGNAATQTLAVVVRGLALKEIELGRAGRVIKDEVVAGAINGVINGIIAAAIAFFLNKSPLLGIVVFLAMIINLMVAGFFGAVVPLIMKKLGKDPASSATIFITTATDVFGFLAFLGLASMMI